MLCVKPRISTVVAKRSESPLMSGNYQEYNVLMLPLREERKRKTVTSTCFQLEFTKEWGIHILMRLLRILNRVIHAMIDLDFQPRYYTCAYNMDNVNRQDVSDLLFSFFDQVHTPRLAVMEAHKRLIGNKVGHVNFQDERKN